MIYILLNYSCYSEKEVLYQLQSKCDLPFVTLIFYLFEQWTIFKYHNYYVFFQIMIIISVNSNKRRILI
jgi:protein-tyrosine phosphatase